MTVIGSNLPSVLLLDHIHDLSKAGLVAHSRSVQLNAFTLLESVAQAASFHARSLINLAQHTFLAEFSSVSIQPLPSASSVDIRVTCCASSQHALQYDCTASHDDTVVCSAQLLIGLREYDNQFRKDLLIPHYSRILQCLHTA
jgi:hypothetical protein